MKTSKILSCILAIVIGISSVAPSMSYAIDYALKKSINNVSFVDYYDEWKKSFSDTYKNENLSGVMATLSAIGGINNCNTIKLKDIFEYSDKEIMTYSENGNIKAVADNISKYFDDNSIPNGIDCLEINNNWSDIDKELDANHVLVLGVRGNTFTKNLKTQEYIMVYKKGAKVAVLNPNHKTQPFHTYLESVIKRSLPKDKNFKHISIKQSDTISLYQFDLSASDKDNVYASYVVPRSSAVKKKSTEKSAKVANLFMPAVAFADDDPKIDIGNIEYSISDSDKLVISGQGEMADYAFMKFVANSVEKDLQTKCPNLNISIRTSGFASYDFSYDLRFTVGDNDYYTKILMIEQNDFEFYPDDDSLIPIDNPLENKDIRFFLMNLSGHYCDTIDKSEKEYNLLKKANDNIGEYFKTELYKVKEKFDSRKNLFSNIEISSGITNISNYAFCANDRIENVLIPDTVSIIGNSAFEYDTSLHSIVLPESIIDIGYSAFDNSGLTSINIPENIEVIKNCAFSNTKLTQVVIPDKVKEIGTWAFFNCPIRQLDLGKGLVHIEGRAFSDIKIKELVLPENVIDIGDSAFYDCSELKSITFPENLQFISYSAFRGCKSLIKVVLPKNLKSIQSFAFLECDNLQEVFIPDNVSFIGGLAFSGIADGSTIYCQSEKAQNLLKGEDKQIRYDEARTKVIVDEEKF